MAEYQVLYWRDVPAQVRVFGGRRPVSKQLPLRFQEIIDCVAMRDGLAGTDEYLSQWQWSEKRPRDGDPEQLLDALIDELVAEYDADDLSQGL
jgi:hypothetical protein